jgi:hypothetical protein
MIQKWDHYLRHAAMSAVLEKKRTGAGNAEQPSHKKPG